jgi:diguanylate cyclase (GGDEF)-like protein
MEPRGLLDRIREEISRRRRMSARMLVLFSVVTVLGFSAVCGSIMLQMRRGAEDLARQTMETLASTIDADINRNIELYDFALRGVVSNLALPQLAHVDSATRNLILFNREAGAMHFGAIQVFDSRGDLTIDAATLAPEPINRGDEAFFRIHRDDPDHGLYISHPKEHQGTHSIVLSRRVSGPDGAFLGVVAGSIRFSYFRELFDRLRLAPDDVVAVIARDGTLTMRTPFKPELIGRNMLGMHGINRALSETRGSFEGPGTFDQVPRMFVWSNGSRPLVVLVGKSWNDILRMWRHQTIWIAAILLGLAVFVASVTVFFIHEIERRAEAEHRLEELATTDPLTGLTNRRKFDNAIDSEWRRAMRQKTPVALLMIDADHFKAYNDGYGHQAGDQVLVGIAVCIADSVHRAGDCAARFGGEEFAVLLPGLDLAAAHSLAETIRRKVEEWSDEQGGVTISVGVASVTPRAPQHWADLVEAADKALYAAKDSGRNRCVVAAGRGELPMVA